MLKLEIDEVTYNVPEGWNEVSLELFDRINELKQDTESSHKYAINLMCILLDVKDEMVIKRLHSEDVMVLNDLFKWVGEEIPKKKVDTVEIEGILYAFPLNLDSLSWGEKADTELIIKNENMETMKGLSKLLSLLLRPAELVKNKETGKEDLVLEEYGAVNYEFRADLFYNNLNMTDINSFRDFFLIIGKSTSKTTTTSGASKIRILR